MKNRLCFLLLLPLLNSCFLKNAVLSSSGAEPSELSSSGTSIASSSETASSRVPEKIDFSKKPVDADIDFWLCDTVDPDSIDPNLIETKNEHMVAFRDSRYPFEFDADGKKVPQWDYLLYKCSPEENGTWTVSRIEAGDQKLRFNGFYHRMEPQEAYDRLVPAGYDYCGDDVEGTNYLNWSDQYISPDGHYRMVMGLYALMFLYHEDSTLDCLVTV